MDRITTSVTVPQVGLASTVRLTLTNATLPHVFTQRVKIRSIISSATVNRDGQEYSAIQISTNAYQIRAFTVPVTTVRITTPVRVNLGIPE